MVWLSTIALHRCHSAPSARQPQPARAELPRVLTIAQAAEFGFSADHARTLVQRGLWRRMVPGMLLTRPERPRRADWATVGLIAGGATAAISGLDALRLLGIRGAAHAELPVLVLSRHVDRRALGAVRLRRTRREYGTWTTSAFDEDLPFVSVVAAARALSDAAGLGASRQAIRAWATEAVQRRLCSTDDLVTEVGTGPRNGSASLRAAIEDVRDGAASIAEARAVDHLQKAQVPPFELNVPVLCGGRLVAVLDILWRALRAVVEIDSRRHHAVGTDWDRTLDRHNRLTTLGLAVRHDAPANLGTRWASDVSRWLCSRAREVGEPFRADPRVLRAGPGGPIPLVLP